MANFEGLIRGAITAKGASTPEQRHVVYESSRNALKKLIEANRSMTVEAAVMEQRSLEDAINSIEYSCQLAENGIEENLDKGVEQTPPPAFEQPDAVPAQVEAEDVSFEQPQDLAPPPLEPDPAAVPETASLAEQFEAAEDEPEIEEILAPLEAESASDPFHEIEQVLGGKVQRKEESAAAQDELAALHEEPVEPIAPNSLDSSVVDDEEQKKVSAPQLDAEAGDGVPEEFTERRKKQRNGLWIVAILILMAAIVWIGYRLFVGVVDGSLLGLGPSQGITGAQSTTDQSSDYITILEPGDLTALVVSDRGRVEIINEQSLEMIRLLSVRDKSDRLTQADPILLRLKPGVVEQIRGKRVTAEVFARSGTSSPAQFSVECRFGENIGCGRKRFRVGVQPEASIFAFTLESNRDINKDTQIAINTDITDNAALTGEGDVLDIVYVRLRSAKQ